MSHFVFILGAGASKHAGAPLMVDFLDQTRKLFAANPSGRYSADIKNVFAAISKLQKVHSKSELDIVNLESVFSVLEMADLLSIEPAVPELLQSMKRLITWTLDETVLFQVSDGVLSSRGLAYKEFAKLVKKLHDKGDSCDIITFNYDLAVDVALYAVGLSPIYGLMKNGVAERGVNLFKLHGSVNWNRCPKCTEIVTGHFPNGRIDHSIAEMKWSTMIGYLPNTKPQCCGNEFDPGDSVIVPPSWDKSEYRASFVEVWKKAAAGLKNAANIVVCGYSMPATDGFFRYLYALGTVSDQLLERFWVFDPNLHVEPNFKNLLGPGARARFEFTPEPFEKAVYRLNRDLI